MIAIIRLFCIVYLRPMGYNRKEVFMKLLLLDSNSLVNRAYYAMPSLRDSSGRCTGGVYGFVNMLAKLIHEEKPTHIACAFDVHAPTFRHKVYDAYKAGRRPMPDELREQIPLLKEVLEAMRIRVVELAGYEADDILGTLSRQASMPVLVVSGDKDVLQLVDDKVTVYHTKRGITDVIAYTPARLAEEGLAPYQVPELKGLMGDASDNIKGVPGVGEKTARTLIAQYKDLDGIYAHLAEIPGKLHDKLEQGKQDAYFSRDLATICRTVPLSIGVEDCLFDPILPVAAQQLLWQLEFKNLVNKFTYQEEAPTPSTAAIASVTIDSRAAMQQAIDQHRATQRLALVCIEGAWHIAFDADTDYTVQVGDDMLCDLSLEDFWTAIMPMLADDKVTKYVFDLKSMYYRLADHCAPFAAQDVQLLHYVADVNRVQEKVEDMLRVLGYDPHVGAAALVAIYDSLLQEVRDKGCEHIYRDVELPLVPVLYEMERNGFRVDVQALRALGERYTAELASLTQDIYSYAGGTFNINSPKQLAEVLYDQLGLPTDKKRSTGADKLEKLRYMHPIVDYILRYRQISKLQSTYVSGMLPLLDSADRLHTVFRQAVTATGRLSSTEPNLQNIPVRTAQGKQIRAAFVASAGCKLVVSDYSQIELRLMAHFSQDATMLDAYRRGEDIHAATAAKVYGVPIEEVTPEMRSGCKAVNFGIIYGISDYGLSENIGISVKKAKEFIEKYFALYRGVRAYMDRAVQQAKELGYATTLFGRRRAIPELHSSVYNVRQFGERIAMNTPLQGTASDIIKMAMIRVSRALHEKNLQAKLILQVHDELVVDSPEAEVDQVAAILKQEMESVCELSVPLVADVGIGDNWVEAK